MAPGAAVDSLSYEALSNLKTYKYQAVDKSFISNYILKHYWNWAVELLPLWLAPNAVTLIGFCFILTNIVCLEIFMPDLVGPGPSWLYYSFAAGLWMYSTMDNIDGKQARRTQSSSPLGELFDHGIDSLNCVLGGLCQAACMGLGPSKIGAFTCILPTLPMFFSTWETYHSHVLYLGYINGPTEGLIIGCLLMAASGFWGVELWTYKASEVIGFPSLFGEAVLRDLWVPVLMAGVFIGHVPACVLNVVNARRRDGLPVLPVFLEWTPMIIFTGASCAWIYSPYSTLLRDNHLVTFCLTISCAFGRMTTKIILAHLTKQPFPFGTVLLAPLVLGAVLVNGPYVGLPALSPSAELLYLRLAFVVTTVIYGRWAYLVIHAICGFLGIRCLRIPYKKTNGVNGNITSSRNAANAALKMSPRKSRDGVIKGA
ncbi:sn-1,2-diacylglycerol cholinephosphotransferase-like protein [Peziza echinospora]|nr:sn-1,2-diacylglycerol cholinephosphotransferase-like protein [Peziza echinospora]